MQTFSVYVFRRRTACAVSAFFCFLRFLSPSLPAATLTWNGGGTDDNWTTSGNWNGTALSAGDFLQFNGTTRLGPVNNLAANTSITGINFLTGAGAFVLSGSTINLGGDVTNSSTTNLQTINLGINMTAARQFSIAAGGMLVGGAIGQTTTGVGISKTGPGTLTLTAANTYSGVTTILQGLFILSGANGALADGAGITVTGGSTLRLLNTDTANNTNRLFNSDAVTLNGGNFDFSNNGGAASYSETAGTLTLTGGINVVSASQAPGGQTSTLTFASLSRTGGVLNFSGTGLGLDTQNRITFTTAPNNNGIVGGFATVGNEFAAWDATLSSVRAMQAGDYVTTDQNTWDSASNVKLTASPSKLTTDRQINSINLAPASTLKINAGGKTLRVESGGILFSGSTAASIQNGVLTTGEGNNVAGDLIFHQNSSAALTVGARITNNGTGVVSLTKAGTGTLILNESAGFTGGTTLLNGTIKLGASSGLSATGALVIGDTSGTVATLDTRYTSQTVSSLTVRSLSATNDVVQVSPGETFTINGAITMGVDSFDSKTSLLFQGGGNLVVNNVGGTVQLGQATLNSNSSSATLDLSGLASATFNMGTTGSVLRVGDINSTSGSVGASTIKLAATTTITVNRISLGGETGQTVNQTLSLGSVATVINTDTLNAGPIGAGARGIGVINFVTTTGTLKLRAANGTSALPTMTVGASVLGTTSGTLSGTVTLTGHSVDILVNALTIGSRTAGTGAVTATFAMDQGTMTATTVAVAQKIGTNSSGAASTGTLTIGGGTVTITSLDLGRNATATGTITGTLNLSGTQSTTIGALTMGTATTSGGTVVAAINLTGGTLTLGGDMLRGGGAGTSTATLTVNGGTLDMGGFAIGSGTNAVTLVLQQGLMRNLGSINGTGGITKTGTGILELQGSNTYGGPTVINAGTLRIGSIANGGSASTTGNSSNDSANLVLNGGTLQYTGAAASTDRLFSIGTTAGSAIDASGTGALNFTNTGSLGFNSQTGTRTLTLTGTNTGSNTLSAAIGDNTGATSLAKTGAGLWVLTGTSTYTGTTTISAGTLRLDFSGTGAPASNIVGSSSGLVMAGGTLNVKGVASGTPAQTFASLAVNAGASTISTTLNGASTLVVTFNGSSITRTAGATVNFVPSATGSFNFTTATNNAAGILGGYAVVNGTDWATLDVSGNVVGFSAYTPLPASGGSTTTNYTLAADLPLSGALTINSLQLTGSTGILAGGSNAITFTGTSGGLIYAPTSAAGSYSITGTGVVGAGTTSEFIVHVNQGTLNIANPMVSSTATAGSFTKSGDGTLVLTGTSAFTGITNVNAGTLEISGTGTLSSSTGNITVAVGATLRVNSTNAAQAIANNTDIALAGTLEVRASETLGGLSGTGTVSNGGGSNAVLTVGNGNETTNFSGLLQDGSTGTLGLTKSGTGTLTLSGTSANSNTGPVSVTAGTLSLAKTSVVALSSDVTVGDGSGSSADILLLSGSEQIANTAIVTVTGNTTAAGAGVFRLNGNTETIGGLSSTGSNQASAIVENALLSTTGRLTVSNVTNQDFAGVLQNGTPTGSVLAFTKTGTAQQTLSGTTANTFTGDTTVLAGTLRLNKTAGVNAIAGNVVLGDGSASAVLSLAASNQIADTALITFSGTGATAGVLRLSGSSETVAGLSSTSGGGIVENESGAANTSTLTVTVATDTVQTFSGTLRDGDGIGTDGTLALSKSGAGTQVLTGDSTYSGGTSVSAGILQVGVGGSTGTLGSGNIANDGLLVINRSGSLALNQTISGSGNLILSGSGTVALTSSANSYSGDTVVDQGTLQVGSNGTGQTGTGTVSINSGATLDGTGVIQASSFNLSNGASLYAGDDTAAASHGTLNFTPANGGGTVSLRGAVFLDISTATNASSVDPLFGGNDIGSAGYIAYVNDTSRSVGLGAGSHDLLSFNTAGDSTSYDLSFLATSGSLQILGSSLTVQKGQIFNLMDWTSLVVTDFTGFDLGTNYRSGSSSGANEGELDLPDISGTGLVWDVSQFTTSGVIVVVPEPSRALFLLIGFGSMFMRRKARRAPPHHTP